MTTLSPHATCMQEALAMQQQHAMLSGRAGPKHENYLDLTMITTSKTGNLATQQLLLKQSSGGHAGCLHLLRPAQLLQTALCCWQG